MAIKRTDKSTDSHRLRIDKWLWAARFFKTRQLASSAIKGGKIKRLQNGTSQRCKPASEVSIGDVLEIQRGAYHYTVDVLKISSQRGSATTAQTLYREQQSSIEQRQQLAEQLRSQPRNPFGGRKPDRRTVRQNRDFKRGR